MYFIFYHNKKMIIGLEKWFSGWRCLPPNLTTWVLKQKFTEWKKRTHPCQLSFDLYIHSGTWTCMCTCTHTHTLKHKQMQWTFLKMRTISAPGRQRQVGQELKVTHCQVPSSRPAKAKRDPDGGRRGRWEPSVPSAKVSSIMICFHESQQHCSKKVGC